MHVATCGAKLSGRFLSKAVLLFGAAEKPPFNIGGIPRRQSHAAAFARVKTANLAERQKSAGPGGAIAAQYHRNFLKCIDFFERHEWPGPC
jgi:hypothetical protein